jgi:hypothetical protein
MNSFPLGVVIILSCGLAFTGYIIYYILRLAHLEMRDGKMDSQGGKVPPRQEDN